MVEHPDRGIASREPDYQRTMNPARRAELVRAPAAADVCSPPKCGSASAYYGMRALLTLYLDQAFPVRRPDVDRLYGGFTALVYLTPLIGGLLADRISGRSAR